MTTDDITALIEIEPWEIRSPAELVAQVADRFPLHEGDVYVVLVRDPSTSQTILDTEVLATASTPVEDDEAASDLIDDLRDRWASRWRDAAGIDARDLQAVTFVVRRGFCGWTDVEWRWANAWRYGVLSIPGGYITVVTEHGWFDLFTRHADHEPTARLAL